MKRRTRLDKVWIGIVVAGIAAAVPPLGLAVGFKSKPVGHHSHPRPVPRISLDKWADDWNVMVGQRTGYTISAYNNTDKDGRIREIIDTLPEGFSYLPGSTSGDIHADPVVNGRKLTWSGNFRVSPGWGTFQFHFEVRASEHPGYYLNVADLVVSGNFEASGTGQTAGILVGIPTELEATGLILEGGSPRLKFSARLTARGRPVAGKWVQFSASLGTPVAGSTYCGAATNADGVAECTSPADVVIGVASLGYDAYFEDWWWGEYAPSYDHADLIE